ncbi:hypothetical protein [Pseudomonas putida]|uniref:Phage protein n=1 Tax=Pseudomonas putida TaxID=303 RepID=A0A2S3WEJ1_PSEPU|nr:hypothetical protein [Pseudomonas putida]POF89352.1 hypothetical protein BGP80_15850 [Pseudomonas putida]
MFEITLNPRNFDQQLTLVREGDVLYLNGEAFDFSPLLEGSTLPASALSSDWFFGDVERVDGVIRLTLWLPHGANAPESTRFPVPITVNADGPVALPIYDEPQDEETPDE